MFGLNVVLKLDNKVFGRSNMFISQDMNELRTSSDEEAESSDEEDTEKATSRSKGKSPVNGSEARKKRAYVEMEYEQEMQPAAKSRATS